MVGELGKLLVLVGTGVVAIGLLVWALAKAGLPLGKLPGDFTVRRGNSTVYIPLASSVLVSVLASLLVAAIRRLRR
jgi:hypothetical protein